MKKWFVVHTKHRNDERAARNLSTGDIEVLAPKLRLKKYRDGTATYTTEPLFPSYIFARFDPIDEYHMVKYTRGVKAIVTFNGVMAPLGNEVVEFIASRLNNGAAAVEDRCFGKGEKVLITDGPFKNLTAIFEEELSGEERVAILLNGISYHARMVIDRNILESTGASNSEKTE